jgi:hypothetical protein
VIAAVVGDSHLTSLCCDITLKLHLSSVSHSVVDLDSLNPDPDPVFLLNPDPKDSGGGSIHTCNK